MPFRRVRPSLRAPYPGKQESPALVCQTLGNKVLLTLFAKVLDQYSDPMECAKQGFTRDGLLP